MTPAYFIFPYVSTATYYHYKDWLLLGSSNWLNVWYQLLLTVLVQIGPVTKNPGSEFGDWNILSKLGEYHVCIYTLMKDYQQSVYWLCKWNENIWHLSFNDVQCQYNVMFSQIQHNRGWWQFSALQELIQSCSITIITAMISWKHTIALGSYVLIAMITDGPWKIW